MKVTYILNVFPKLSETFILNEMRAMRKKGVEIEVFAYEASYEKVLHPGVRDIDRWNYFQRDKVVQSVCAHLAFLLKNPLKYFQTIWFVFRAGNSGGFSRSGDGLGRLFVMNLHHAWAVHRSGADHLHAHFGMYAADLAMLTNRLTGIPYTFTTHGHDIYKCPPKNFALKSRLAKKHVTVSRYNKRYLIDHFGVRDEDLEVIRCGVDFESIPPGKEEAGGHMILSVARLSQEKGLDLLVSACRILKDQGVDFECRIVGEGPERPALEKLIQEQGLEGKVRLLGARTQGEIFSLLAQARVKVLPSRSGEESMGVALMEAMACGVPVVGPDTKGVPELVEDGECGFLVPPENVGALAEKIKVLLTDKALGKQFAEKGRRKVFREFNLKTETDKLLSLWKQV